MSTKTCVRIVLLLVAFICATSMAMAAQLRPQHDIHLTFDYAKMSYSGYMEITAPVPSGDQFEAIDFHLYANASGVTRASENTPNIVIEKVLSGQGEELTFTQEGTVLHVLLQAPQSTFAKVQIHWRGQVPRIPTPPNALADLLPGDLNSILGGATSKSTSYRDYGLYSFRNGIVSLGTYWFPMLAVRSGEKWQTDIPAGPGDLSVTAASDYQVSLEVTNAPANISVICAQAASKNAILKSQIAAARDFPVIIAENFAVQSREVTIDDRTVTVSSWAREPNSAKSAEVLDTATYALQNFSRRFGDYPWEHFTVVQGPLSGGAGGAEFSGLAMISQALYVDWETEFANTFQGAGLLLQQQLQPLKSLLETTVAHEVAHQWWGIKVGSDVRRQPWLDESLTNYCAALYYKDRYADQRFTEMVQTNLKQPYQMARFLGLPDNKVSNPTSDFVNDLQYGAIVYGKGALFFQALHQLMGDEKFDGALQKYFSRYGDQMASSADLIQLFKEADPAHSDAIENLYEHWIHQLNGDADIGVLSIADLLGM